MQILFHPIHIRPTQHAILNQALYIAAANPYILKKILSLLFIVCSGVLTCTLSAQKTDTLLVASGDIIIGEIISLDKGELIFDTQHLGKLKVERQNILWLKTNKQVSLTTTHSEILIGTYEIKDNKMVFYSEQGDTIQMTKKNVAEMYPLGQGFWQSARGSIGAGYNYTRSNRLSQGNFTANLNYLKEHMFYSATATYIGSQSPSEPLEENLNASFTVDRIFDNYTFIGAEYAPQRNTALQLHWRNTLGTYFGKRQMLSPFSFITGSLGLSLNNEFFNASEENELPDQSTSAEMNATIRVVFKRSDKPKLRSEILADYYRRIGEERNRYNINATGSIRLYTDLWLSLTYYLNFDDKPQGINSNDYGFISNLSYTF
jgi:hypothetical protein